MKDIGIIDIDKYGRIHRWWFGDRKYVSDHFPPGPGWMPEIYLSYILNQEDGAFYHPNLFYHLDNNPTNNDPSNIEIFNGRYLQYGPSHPTQFEHVYIGHMQDRVYPITKIKRCSLCGIPVYSDPITSFEESELCTSCYYDHYDPEDDELTLEPGLLNFYSQDIVENIFIDHQRGYLTEQLKQKYKQYDIDILEVIPSHNPIGEFQIKPYSKRFI